VWCDASMPWQEGTAAQSNVLRPHPHATQALPLAACQPLHVARSSTSTSASLQQQPRRSHSPAIHATSSMSCGAALTPLLLLLRCAVSLPRQPAGALT
jgi:hypothetical protein